MKDHAAQTNNKDAELVQLKIAVRAYLGFFGIIITFGLFIIGAM
jgi:hypothetical protein